MPTEELQQALRSANITNVEKDFADLICKMFDVPRPLVLRMMYALQYASAEFVSHNHWMNPDELDGDLRKAISLRVKEGYARTTVRQIIERKGFALAWVTALVPEDKPHLICNGCPKSLECIDEGLHKPEDCRIGKGAWKKTLEVRPIKMNKDTVIVESEHPQGTFTLNIKDLDL